MNNWFSAFAPSGKTAMKIDWATCVTFARNDDAVLSGGRDGVLRLWNTNTLTLEMHSPAHTAVTAVATLGGTGDRIVSSSIDGSICFWDFDKNVLIRNFAQDGAPGYCLAALPDESAVISGHYLLEDSPSGIPMTERAEHPSMGTCRLFIALRLHQQLDFLRLHQVTRQWEFR